MPAGFQSQVYTQPAIGVAGDRASDNPIITFLAGPGGLVAGSGGVTIGNFAWVTPPLDANNAPSVASSNGVGAVSGFVIGDLQGLNSTFLSYAGMQIPAGQPVTLATGGEFIAVNSGAGYAQRGMKAYATFGTGAITFAATGAPTTASATATTITAGTTASFTGSISGDVLTAATVTNTIYPGAVITTGSGVAANTYILSQLTGTTGGAGTYLVSIGEQSIAAESMVATPYILTTTGGTVTGTIGVGGVIQSASTGVTGTVVGMAVTALYATGVWVVQPAPFAAAGTLTSATVTVSNNVETPWYALNGAAQNEPIKIGAGLTSLSALLS